MFNLVKRSLHIKTQTKLLFILTMLTVFLGCSETDELPIIFNDDFDQFVISKTNTEVLLQLESQMDFADNGVSTVLISLDNSDEIKRFDVVPDTPFLATVNFEDLTPNTEYHYTVRYERSDGELFISEAGGSFKTYPTVPIPEIKGTGSEKHWPGGFMDFVGENLSFNPFTGDEVFIGDFETSGSPEGVFIPDNTPAGLYTVSMKYAYHEVVTDAIVNVVHQEISSIDTDFDSDRTYGGGYFTVYGSNFHPEADENEVYLDGERLKVWRSSPDSLYVSLVEHFVNAPGGGVLEPGVYNLLNLKIESYEVEVAFNVTIIPRPCADLNDMQVGIYDGSLFEANGKAYIVGGVTENEFSDKLWEYDPSSDSWNEKSPFPGGARSGGVAFALGGKGYFGLGESVSQTYNQDWWEYDPTSDSWKQLKDFEGGGLLYGVGFAIDDTGYVGAGVSSGNMRKGDFWKYNGTTDAWIRIADYPNGEERASATVLEGKAYVGFGNNGSLQPNNKLYVYDPQIDGWNFVTEDPYESRSDGVLLTIEESIYFVSGFDATGDASWMVTEYTVNTDTWEQKTACNATFSGVGMTYEGNLILMGGQGLGAIPKIVREYNPSNELN